MYPCDPAFRHSNRVSRIIPPRTALDSAGKGSLARLGRSPFADSRIMASTNIAILPGGEGWEHAPRGSSPLRSWDPVILCVLFLGSFLGRPWQSPELGLACLSRLPRRECCSQPGAGGSLPRKTTPAKHTLVLFF
jgi:hypothetical protein